MSKATIESTTSSFYAEAKLPDGVAVEQCPLNVADEDGIVMSTLSTTESLAMTSSSSPTKAIVSATKSIGRSRTPFSSPTRKQNIGSAYGSREVALLSPCRDVDSQSWGEAQIIAEAQLIVELQIVTVDTVSTMIRAYIAFAFRLF